MNPVCDAHGLRWSVRAKDTLDINLSALPGPDVSERAH